MPFPCHAVPISVYNMSFPFDLHSAAVSDTHLPCRADALLRPCRSSQGHGTALPSIDGLWATCPCSASSGYHAEFHEHCYQKHTNLLTTVHTYVCTDRWQHTTKRRPVKLAVRIFPATTRISTKDMALSEEGRGAAWYV
jgi:hypothetical protein